MKKFVIALCMLLLSACNASSDIKVEVVEDLYFVKDKETEFAVKLTDGNQTLNNLEVSTQFSMKGMDHGTYEAELVEQEEGIYSGKIGLSMAGEWEVTVTFQQDGEAVEKIFDYTVKEPEGVAKLNGTWITKEDLEFYRFINQLHIEMARETDRATYQGQDLENALAYWDAQAKLVQDRNQLLTQLIRLRSMALLSEEKGFKATKEEVDVEVAKVRSQYEASPVAKTLIAEFGEKRFWEIEQAQYELIVLTNKIQQDLITKVKAENPSINDQEASYLAQKEYEELLVSQVNSMEIELL